ncbi:MAG: single-stranded-DNA-specific exonuclease RecJ [Candidatus Marinimicrobia bacterium]|nr:single-stranded-DNA-specific exonuclease RecJ [Candidatus Neomarinimicrobiota bacterium]
MKWKFKNLQPENILEHSKKLKTSYFFSNILLSRDIETVEEIERFFHPADTKLYDPFLLLDMDKSVKKIHSLINSEKKLLIFGDYDVDGVTSTSLLYQFFSKFSKNISYYIPNRETEGYGLSKIGIDYASENNISLIITCDCGISSVDEIDYATSKNIETIVTDHHQPDNVLPNAYSIVNPKRKNDKSLNKDLAGVGVAYKLISAYCQKYDIPQKEADEFLYFVALGTSADIVKMRDENRVLTFRGVQQINESNIGVGLAELIKVCNFKNEDINVTKIVFNIAPRLNASGRLMSADNSVNLLITDDVRFAREEADTLNELNIKRRSIQDEVLESALFQIQEKYGNEIPKIIILSSDKWHPGVVGIVSSKIKEEYYRPNFLISFRDGLGKGSGRSIRKFNLYDSLANSKKYLEGFGGHFFAAGLGIKKENINNFDLSISKYANENITNDDLEKSLFIDAEARIEDINSTLLKFVEKMRPYGPGNMRPVFCMIKVRPYKARILKDKHLKFIVKSDKYSLNCIGWSMADKFEMVMSPDNEIDIAFVVEINEWNNVKNIQLVIKDIKKWRENGNEN